MDKSQNINSSQTPKNTDSTSVFSGISLFSFISKKTEKLATALYMVTNLFYESEPMKWTLRRKISELLSFILKHRDTYTVGNLEFVHDAKKGVVEILSLLEVASGSGLISPMNFSVIRAEFVNLVEHIEKLSHEQNESDYRELPKTFFEVQKDMTSSVDQSKNSLMSNTNIKDNISLSQDNSAFKRTNRQQIILQLLKKKKEVNIKDIALIIKDCSEKTIQREVIDLIEKGVLKKEGDRRWSKYSLASAII